MTDTTSGDLTVTLDEDESAAAARSAAAVESPFDEAYRVLRLMIGLVAITLAPIVVMTDEIFGEGVKSGSLSAYYYGVAGNWFVGGLCVIGVFFFSYEIRPRPGRELDNWLSTAGGICAVIVALVPTGRDATRGEYRFEPAMSLASPNVHIGAAAIMLVILAVFCFYLFTKTDHEAPSKTVADHVRRFFRTDWIEVDGVAASNAKQVRNVIFRSCGWIIVAALITAAFAYRADGSRLFFWSEIVAVTAFALAWLVKGGAIPLLNDPADA